MSKEQCSNCRYYSEPSRPAASSAVCRKGSPDHSGFPPVEPDEWCGEWTSVPCSECGMSIFYGYGWDSDARYCTCKPPEEADSPDRHLISKVHAYHCSDCKWAFPTGHLSRQAVVDAASYDFDRHFCRDYRSPNETD